MQSTIAISNLQVQAGSQPILTDINLEIPVNRITVLLGPSGCGKTTLLRCMNRLNDLDKGLKVSGRILIDGEDIYADGVYVPGVRQKMGLLSQRPWPLPMSIAHNIAYGLKLKGERDKRQITHKVEEHLRQVGLWDEVRHRLGAPATSLSIGQQQRLCLARGLAVQPSIILADEPTSALDPTSSKIIENLFRQLKQQYTIILVTHILRQAKRLADHVVFMSDGRIIEQGPPDQLFTNPQSPQLRDYLVDGN
ncbi:MAG TPA: phosphate ABC transporter ATP-binding protein [Bacteroidales bacterium]|nr:phosphate ABC transporter ATP-binding protein [Bacteroidales bacterium]HRZ47892.1 phosphate ABC transporter ATP-binding protein [Bacteroidales bacterium]